jgi:hypothetical protein
VKKIHVPDNIFKKYFKSIYTAIEFLYKHSNIFAKYQRCVEILMVWLAKKGQNKKNVFNVKKIHLPDNIFEIFFLHDNIVS